jgi:hypothetical protein
MENITPKTVPTPVDVSATRAVPLDESNIWKISRAFVASWQRIMLAPKLSSDSVITRKRSSESRCEDIAQISSSARACQPQRVQQMILW